MRISRRFTTEDQTPYAGIEFVERNSEIRNPDGTTVFRQEGIAVPAEWSSVAVDILAQKYFGKSGVPQLGPDGRPLLDGDGRPARGGARGARQGLHRLAARWAESAAARGCREGPPGAGACRAV